MPTKRHGLRLTLPGAPTTPHTVPGVAGYYRPDIATPVGGEGELTLEAARKLAADESIELELVELAAGEAKEAAELAKQTIREARKGLVAARRLKPKGDEREQVADEQEAIRAAEKLAAGAARKE